MNKYVLLLFAVYLLSFNIVDIEAVADTLFYDDFDTLDTSWQEVVNDGTIEAVNGMLHMVSSNDAQVDSCSIRLLYHDFNVPLTIEAKIKTLGSVYSVIIGLVHDDETISTGYHQPNAVYAVLNSYSTYTSFINMRLPDDTNAGKIVIYNANKQLPVQEWVVVKLEFLNETHVKLYFNDTLVYDAVFKDVIQEPYDLFIRAASGAVSGAYADFYVDWVKVYTDKSELKINIHYIYHVAFWDSVDDPIIINDTWFNFVSQSLVYDIGTVLHITIPSTGKTIGGLDYSTKVYINGSASPNDFIVILNGDTIVDIYVYVFPPSNYMGQWIGKDNNNNTLVVLVPGFKYIFSSGDSIEVENTSIVQSIAVLMSYDRYYILKYGEPWVFHSYQLDNSKQVTIVNETYNFGNQLLNGTQLVFGYMHGTTYYPPNNYVSWYRSEFGVIQRSDGQYRFRTWINQTGTSKYTFYYEIYDNEGGQTGYVNYGSEKYGYYIHAVIVNDTSYISNIHIENYDVESDTISGFWLDGVFYRTDIITINHTEYDYATWGHYINLYEPLSDYNIVDANGKTITLMFDFNAYEVKLYPIIGTKPIVMYNVKAGDTYTFDPSSFGLYKLVIYYTKPNVNDDNNSDDSNIINWSNTIDTATEPYSQTIAFFIKAGMITTIVLALLGVFGRHGLSPLIMFIFALSWSGLYPTWVGLTIVFIAGVYALYRFFLTGKQDIGLDEASEDES